MKLYGPLWLKPENEFFDHKNIFTNTAKPYGPLMHQKLMLVAEDADSGSSPETYNRAKTNELVRYPLCNDSLEWLFKNSYMYVSNMFSKAVHPGMAVL